MNEPDILKPQDWSFPIPIVYGLGRLAEIGQRCIAMGVHRPMIVTDRDSKDLPFMSELCRYLADANLSFSIFSDISPNPRDNEIGSGRYKFRSGEHDAVIAIGGGSAMDGGKAICLTAKNDIDLWDFEWEADPVKISLDQAFPKLITIPTTAGTGAETESTAMVTDTKKGVKRCVWHPKQKPVTAILDPILTLVSDLEFLDNKQVVNWPSYTQTSQVMQRHEVVELLKRLLPDPVVDIHSLRE